MHTSWTRRLPGTLAAILTAMVLLIVTALPAAAMTVTFVRHGESQGNASGKIDTSVPGPHLTELGQTQSEAVAAALIASGIDYDAVYVSNMVRTAETAQPFLDATGRTATTLPGVREISAGIFEGQSEDGGLGRIGYALAPLAWTLGNRFFPVIGGSDGNAFDARVDGALQQIEADGAQNPVIFSHGATIMFWTMMNVDNPDLSLMLSHPLDNTDIVVVDGSAEEGWTLKSWAGQEVGPANLPTKLIVNFRDLVVTPQTAVYNVVRAFSTGDVSKIANAIRDGVVDTVKAPIKFTQAVVRDIGDEIRGTRAPEPVQNAGVERKAASAPKVTEVTEVTERDDVGAATDTADSKDNDTATDTKIASVSDIRKGSTATDLTDGNKVEPGTKHAVPRPVRQLQKAADDLREQVETSLDRLGDAVKKATGQTTKPGKAETADTGTKTKTDTKKSGADAATGEKAAA